MPISSPLDKFFINEPSGLSCVFLLSTFTITVSDAKMLTPSETSTVAEYVPSSVSWSIVIGKNMLPDLNPSNAIVWDEPSANSDISSRLTKKIIFSGELFSMRVCIVATSFADRVMILFP